MAIEEAKAAASRIVLAVREADMVLSSVLQQYAREHGLTLTQVFLLRALCLAPGPVTLGELASDLNLAMSSTSVEVERLVKRGYVMRSIDPECRRRVQIEVTPQGRDFGASGPELLVQRLAQLLSTLPEHEATTIETGLTRLTQLLEGLRP